MKHAVKVLLLLMTVLISNPSRGNQTLKCICQVNGQPLAQLKFLTMHPYINVNFVLQ